MAMGVQKLPKRSEVPEELTWDLTVIFPNQAAFTAAVKELHQNLTQLQELKGSIHDGASLARAVTELFAVNRKLEKIYTYASMKNDEDTSNNASQALFTQAQSLLTQTQQASAWFEPEVLQFDRTQVEAWLANTPELADYRRYLMQVMDQKEHVLPAEQEKLLAQASAIFAGAENTFSTLSNADLKFPVVEDDAGQQVELSDGGYAQLLESADRKVRQNAFTKLYEVYGQFQHTFAQTLLTQARTDNYLAHVHKYPSTQARALANTEIPVVVYQTLVKAVHNHLSELHEYVQLRKEVLQLNQVEMYDMYTPLVGKAPLSFTYDEAKQVILKALAPLGDEYLQLVQKILNERNIDVVENQGKRTGAYSGGAYDTPPYILLNWQDSLENLYTLIHEMGHSVHSALTRKYQPYATGDYPIFLAEIASTTNENLLTNYLLEHTSDDHVKAYILNHYLDGVKGTIFRQTQFAEFEAWLHEQLAADEPLTATELSQYYGELNAQYYGLPHTKTTPIKLEWARIPHFYYNFYVYQYATGFAVAATLAGRISANEPGAVAAYLDFLKSGSSRLPLATMKLAGVDLTQTTYLDAAFKEFAHRLTQLKTLLNK